MNEESSEPQKSSQEMFEEIAESLYKKLEVVANESETELVIHIAFDKNFEEPIVILHNNRYIVAKTLAPIFKELRDTILKEINVT